MSGLNISSPQEVANKGNNNFGDIPSKVDTVLGFDKLEAIERMKLRCPPTTIGEASKSGVLNNVTYNEESVIYWVIPFPDNMLNSTSFSSKIMNNIIVVNGKLMQLLFEYDESVKTIKLSYKLIQTTEYSGENGLIARKFERYI